MATLSHESSLAAACATWPPSDCRTETIRAAAAKALDWTLFLRVVERHGVWGFVHEGLNRVKPNIPPEIMREIDAKAASLVRNSLAMAAEAIRLQRLFDAAGVPLLFLKGASLAMLAYGNLGLRGAKDVDLLVSPEFLEPAIALLQRAGYHRFDPPPSISDRQLRILMQVRGDLGFNHDDTDCPVELHWGLFLNPYAMSDASVMAKSRVVPITGHNGLRTLGEEDLFTFLCVHGALHVWNRLKWLADINALLAKSPEGSAQRFYRAACERGAGPAAAQAMLLCHRLLGLPLPAHLVSTLHQSRRARWLEETALRTVTLGQGELDPRDVRFGTTRGTLSTFLVGQVGPTAQQNCAIGPSTKPMSWPCRYRQDCGFSIQSCGCQCGFGAMLTGDRRRVHLKPLTTKRFHLYNQGFDSRKLKAIEILKIFSIFGHAP